MAMAQGLSRYKWLTEQGVLWKMRCIQTRRLFSGGPCRSPRNGQL